MYVWNWEFHVYDRETNKIFIITEDTGYPDKWSLLENFFNIMKGNYIFELLNHFVLEDLIPENMRVSLDDFAEVLKFGEGYNSASEEGEFDGPNVFYNLARSADSAVLQRFMAEHAQKTKGDVYEERFVPLDVFFCLHNVESANLSTYISPSYEDEEG